MSENKTGNQYRATKIWHEIIESFQANVPVKRHWRNFRAYSDCFAANEAIEWLYRYLKTSHNFKSQTTITRQQAIQLLQIFLKERIIEDVRGEKYNTKEFQDDDRLYKFCSVEKYSIQYRKHQHTNGNSNANQNIEPTNPTVKKLVNNAIPNTTTTTVQKQLQQENVQIQQQSRRLSITTKILKEKNLNQEKQTTSTIPTTTTATTTVSTAVTKTKLSAIENYDNLINYDQFFIKSNLKESNIKTTSISKTQQQQQQQQNQHELNEIWSMVAIDYLYDILKFDINSAQSLLDNLQLISSNLHYNSTHVNKHGVVTNSNNKLEDLPAWVMQAMTSLVHWTDFKKDHENESKPIAKLKSHPSFRDVFNEVNNYFLDHKEPLLSKQLSKVFIKILKIFIANTKQFEIDEFMRNLKEHLNSQTHHNDFNYIDNDLVDSMNSGNITSGCHDNDNDMCCTQCLSTYDFVNNWLNCNEIEFNEFVMNLNANYKFNNENEQYIFANSIENEQENSVHSLPDMTTKIANKTCNLSSLMELEPERKRTKMNYSATTDELSTILADKKNNSERKLRRNNSFIAAITDNNNSSSNSSNNSNTMNKNSSNGLMYKTHSLDQINDNLVKDDLSVLTQKPASICSAKRTPSFNDTQKIKNLLVNSISLNNIAASIPTKFAKMSVGALSSLISSVSLKDLDNGSDNLGFEYDTFKQIIKAFRMLALSLPPINKRKLHLLLRLLYKLKFSEHSKLLVINEFEQNDADYEMDYDNLNVEPIIINAFLKSIIAFDEHDENIAMKIVQILINNYSEVMRIPDDYVSIVQENIAAKSKTFCSKISMEQYENEKNESKQHLIKLLYNILTNVAITQDDKLKRLKQFKEIYPDIYEEKYATIKKAINVLGINETTKNRYQLAKKRTLNATTINPNITSTNDKNEIKSNKNLDTTNIVSNINTIQTPSINFPKFLLPKTFKKVRL